MAERVRFELTVLAYTRVPGVHLKPLGHLSAYLLLGAGCCVLLNKRSAQVYQSKNGLARKKKTLLLGPGSAPVSEEINQHSAALFLQNASGNVQEMIEFSVRADLVL